MFHDLETIGSIHPIHNWEYADATARNAATGFAVTDVKKIALQLDDMSFWVLADLTPTWEPVSKAGASTGVTAAAVLAANALVIGQGGARGTQTVPGITSDGVSKVTLGEAGVSEGAVRLANATSGTVEIKPPAGALGTSVMTTPTGTGTLLASGASKAEAVQSAEYAADAGGSDAYAITLTPAVTAYVTGVKYRFKANTANTGAATLNINSVGAQTIKKVAGGITTDLDTNDIRAGQWVEVVWDGTNFQMTSQLGNAAGGGGFGASTPADELDAAFHAADAGASDAYAITLSPAISSLVTGTHYVFKANTANTGAATLNINGLGAQTIKKAAGGVTTDLATNDIRAGQWVLVVWDGTNFQMLSLLGNAPGSTAPTTATTTSTGTQNDFDFSNADRLFVNAASTLTLNGLVAGVDGQALDVLVKGAGACYLVNEAGGSTAANRILTRFQSPLIVATGGAVRLVYDGTAARWVVTDWSSGVPTGPMNYTELKRSTDQTAPTATATYASFGTEVSNAWGVFSSGNPTRLTVPTGQGGLWTFSIHWFLNQALTGQVQLGARINGSTFVFADDLYMSGSTAQKVSTWFLNLAAGDYVEFYYYQASGSDKTFQVQTFNCFRLS